MQVHKLDDDTTKNYVTINSLETYQFSEDELNFYASKLYKSSFIKMQNEIFNKFNNINYNEINNNIVREDKFYLSGWAPTEFIAYNRVAVKTTDQGIRTIPIKYEGDNIIYKIKASGKFCYADYMEYFIFGYTEDNPGIEGTSWHTFTDIGSVKATDRSTETEFDIEFTFDPANFAVYKGDHILSVAFSINNNNDAWNENAYIQLDSIKVTVIKDYMNNELYSENFESMTKNIFSKIGQIESKINQQSSAVNNIATDIYNNRYDLRINTKGNFVSIPHIPNKIIFIGNSFLLGQGFYGMCATDPIYDWYYRTMQAIINKNPNVISYRCPGAWFETMTSDKNLDTEFSKKVCYSKANVVNGELKETLNANIPFTDIFKNDIDCIIVQLGDNADGTLDTFNNNIDKFILKLYTLCPNARILWLGSSARYQKTKDASEKACTKYGITLIPIQYIRDAHNDFEGTSGQTYLKADGTREETPKALLSHAGNNGHKYIAEAVIKWMDM